MAIWTNNTKSSSPTWTNTVKASDATWSNQTKSISTIAFNSVLNSLPASASSPLTYSFTNTSGNYLIVAFTILDKGTPTAVTYGGVAMSLLASNTDDVNENVYVYGLAAPATGANNVVITWSGDHTVGSRAYSLSNVSQTGQPDTTNSGTANGTSVAVAVTTTNDRAWIIGFIRCATGGNAGAGSNTTKRNSDTNSTAFLEYTSNPKTPAGSQSTTATNSSTGRMIYVVVALSPAE